MPATPQTASFHVDAIAAQRVSGDVRLLVRTKETPPFALLFTPALADQIGLRVIVPEVGLLPTAPVSIRRAVRVSTRKTGSGRKLAPGHLELYTTIMQRIEALGGSVNISRLLRDEFPGAPYRSFKRWYDYRKIRERISAAKATAA